jgi:formylglycine-generating enzyme required for sulfatase activity
MLGNVWEWCEDGYAKDAYSNGKKGANHPVNRNSDSKRTIRGGSWYSRPGLARCACRDHLHDSSRRGYDVGFRLVRVN